MQGAGYDVGSRFARGGIRTAAVTVCFDLTADSTGRTHRDHHKCCCIDASYITLHPQQSASINERLEHELETNGRNDEQERRCEGLRYRRKH